MGGVSSLPVSLIIRTMGWWEVSREAREGQGALREEQIRQKRQGWVWGTMAPLGACEPTQITHA